MYHTQKTVSDWGLGALGRATAARLLLASAAKRVAGYLVSSIASGIPVH